MGGQPVAARRAAKAEVDAARCDGLEHAELLGDLEAGVMRQHHAGAADADAAGGRGDGGDQDLGRGASLAGGGMVLGEPVALVAEGLAVLGEGDALADRVIRAAAGDDGGLVEDGKQWPQAGERRLQWAS